MKALTINQPWLYCITDLDKRIENRFWKPSKHIIGKRIALHSSKSFDELGGYAVNRLSGLAVDLTEADLPYGAIVATATVIGWVYESGDASHPSLRIYINNKWFFGPYGWILEDVRKLTPTVCRGAPGLWDVSQSVMRTWG